MGDKVKTYTNEYYDVKRILGHDWANIYILLGSREVGKSFSILSFCISQFFKSYVKEKDVYELPFFWLRLTEASTKKLLGNNAQQFVDIKLMEKFNLFERLTVRGNSVFYTADNGKRHLMAKILALSTFYSDKGVALFNDMTLSRKYSKSFNIVLDEFQRERNEKNTFDIRYALVNQLENLIRSRKDSRIFIVGNTLEEASDILLMFNFIPESYGTYKLKRKKTVIDYIAPSEKYIKRRKGSIADILAPDESTFTNEIKNDFSLITKKRPLKPSYIIMFDKSEKSWYTVWDTTIIKKYNGEIFSDRGMIPMRRLIGAIYVEELVNEVLMRVNRRHFKYVDLYTQKSFEQEIRLLKNIK